jgi:hypothetical protein
MTDWKSRLERILPRVERPGRYVGGEVNAVRKDWDATPTRVALIFPDLYGPLHQPAGDAGPGGPAPAERGTG